MAVTAGTKVRKASAPSAAFRQLDLISSLSCAQDEPKYFGHGDFRRAKTWFDEVRMKVSYVSCTGTRGKRNP
ncbi:hypothetical protein [Amycolatopsis kentuckyensis]|uniref:hypothetical protein n=1 Tax=Amycolatopsis kentuckyensis TaxID=218823 RepID=UPI0011779733|nr:hypothetical protein [Amycolatopsis kentuckyensis]